MAKSPPPTISKREEAARTEAALRRLAALARQASSPHVQAEEVVYGPPAPVGAPSGSEEVQRGRRLEERTPDPAPGHRRIRWVGESSPLDNPVVVWGLATNRYDALQAETIRAYHRRRIRPTPNHDREMTRDRDGFSRDWVWGPSAGTYVRLMPNRDADRLLSGPSGPEFRDIDAADAGSPLLVAPTDLRQMGEPELAGLVADAYRTVPAGVRLREETRYDAFSRTQRREGEFHVAGTGWGDD